MCEDGSYYLSVNFLSFFDRTLKAQLNTIKKLVIPIVVILSTSKTFPHPVSISLLINRYGFPKEEWLLFSLQRFHPEQNAFRSRHPEDVSLR